ncbi:hypothetical protein [Mycobacterium sp. AZCC_0083]|uniref:hypothetical protein n=1 Tax=Mycobacterium sp. AZCC_0083 TaxID=2735882 RepID=UPI00161A5B06|nr:hypothetical protein [Mycobacterium sp. AZCC_0083]MBB5166304.1 hypothetical protein [Mycobacterium sp. AZCC_0083]
MGDLETVSCLGASCGTSLPPGGRQVSRHAGPAQAVAPPTGWRHALLGALRRRSLYRTIPAAAIVGVTLFMVNLYASVRNGPFTTMLAIQIALTFVVPWLNATMGIAIGLRHGSPSPVPGTSAGPDGSTSH